MARSQQLPAKFLRLITRRRSPAWRWFCRMPRRLAQLSAEDIRRIRAARQRGDTLKTIAADYDVSPQTVRSCVAHGQKGDGAAPARDALIGRLWRAADAQVRDIELRLSAEALPAEEREREMRAMAVLVKTLRDLNELDAARGRRGAQGGGNAGAAADVNYDDPRQIDDFRRELARRIEAIKSGAATDAAGGS
jgi:hypothetical protein